MHDFLDDANALASGADVALICPTTSQPRYHKRARQLKELGLKVHVFAFERSYYNENRFSEDIPVTSLGSLRDRAYILRIPRLFKAARCLRRYAGVRKPFYYAMSLDCMFLARLSGIRNGYYEVGDLRTASRSASVYAVFEKILLSRVLGLVLTSKYFYENYYSAKTSFPRKKVYVIDNKISAKLRHTPRPERSFDSKPLRIGLIGLLRYRRPIELLLEFAKNHPDQCRVECYGDGPCRYLLEQSQSDNICYHGSFRSPQDLADIYSGIDINYVVYDTTSRNVRLAIPNKLFESAFFGVPIICAEDTALAQEAASLNIGCAISWATSARFAEIGKYLDEDRLKSWSRNCLKIPIEQLMDDGDAVLRKMIQEAYDITV